jgi:LysR family glycine cleavage system transcriptional activator
MAVLAAREGRGVACVPTKDIEMLPWRDELIHPFDGPVHTGHAYYLLYRGDSVRLAEIQLFRDWMLRDMSAGSRSR